jgi:hypothetical protein
MEQEIVPPVFLDREGVIARVVDGDGGWARAETWTGNAWRRASSLLFPDIFRAKPLSSGELEQKGVRHHFLGAQRG